VTTDQRVVAKQDIQEVESAKRAGAPYSHHRNQAKDKNIKLQQKLSNAPRARRYRDKPSKKIKEHIEQQKIKPRFANKFR
jgi:hypothetical protein